MTTTKLYTYEKGARTQAKLDSVIEKFDMKVLEYVRDRYVRGYVIVAADNSDHDDQLCIATYHRGRLIK